MNRTVARASLPTSDRIDHLLRAHGAAWAERIHAVAGDMGRWGLVAILLGFGAYKFTAVEAEGIFPLVSNHPLMSWLYSVGSVRAVSSGIGITEIIVAVLLATHRWWPRAALLGGVGAVGMFLTTLSFALTTPGATADATLFGFLVKDFFLVVASAHAASASLRAAVSESVRGERA